MSLFLLLLTLGSLAGLSGCASWNAEKNYPLHGKLVNIGEAKIHVREIGNKDSLRPPVVLIHGASANLRDMEMSLGEALSGDYRVIMVDRPGRGYSGRPDQGYRLDVQASAIRDAVTALGAEKPIIVGQSLGGAVALNYALQYQDEMTALVALAPVSHEWPGGVAWYNKASGVPVVGFILRRFIVPVYGHFVVNNGVDETFAPDAAPADYIKRSGLSLLFRPGDFKSNASDIANLKDEIRRQQGRYGELGLPVVVMHGLADDAVSPDLHAQALGREVDGIDLTLFPDTGHALHHSKTAEIVAAIDSISAAALQSQP